ncbi:MAG: outer membrane protein assembly factor BamE [Thiocapsa sp.]|jgi:outer membrane protein assembly factor BamE|nr:outer membrane protein assembly factor BamE [Thiocapsa sp.]MCG6896876.1 outer membrane protein assembly factor BamE [Thiocapsa sp.]MCG6985500.1 outer membrane protein assembly factor BamE [Thiocapsa sp.]
MPTLLQVLLLGWLVVSGTAGCSWGKKPDQYRGSVLEQLPFVYKMTVQQGNIITEEMVDGLELGMTKRQVQFLLGTPVLTDFFRTDRWDYTYTIQRGHQPMEIRYLTLHFSEDSLARIEGDIRPDPARTQGREPAEMVVSVPDHEERKGFIKRSLEAVGLERKD